MTEPHKPDMEALERQMQFVALQQAVTMLAVEVFKMSGDASATADRLLREAEKMGDIINFQDVDPALSDWAAQEFRDFLVRILSRARSRATGETFDPERFRSRNE